MARVLFASNEEPRPREKRIFAFTTSYRADSHASPVSGDAQRRPPSRGEALSRQFEIGYALQPSRIQLSQRVEQVPSRHPGVPIRVRVIGTCLQ